jgi:hypothetical protein
MNLKETLYFYRILNWNEKISGSRPIGYTFLGYMMAGELKILPIIFNLFVILGVLSFWYSINDYFDFKIQKEKNFLATKIKSGELSERKAILFCLLPLLLMVFLLFIIKKHNYQSLYYLLIIFILTTFYSIPPVRIKKRKFLSFLIPPVGASLLFLQGYTILREPTLSIILLSIILFMFQLFLEALHIMEDFTKEKEIKKIKNPDNIIAFIRKLPLLSILISLFFSFINLWFLTTTLFSFLRYIYVRKVTFVNIHNIRTNLLSPIWSLYEFMVYGILGVLNIFN